MLPLDPPEQIQAVHQPFEAGDLVRQVEGEVATVAGSIRRHGLYSSRTRPRRVATLTASVRLVTPSFSNRWPRCVLTVRSLMSSAVAISLFALPSAISLSAAISRGVSCTRVTPSASLAAAAGAM